jgi:hypothetical protein
MSVAPSNPAQNDDMEQALEVFGTPARLAFSDRDLPAVEVAPHFASGWTCTTCNARFASCVCMAKRCKGVVQGLRQRLCSRRKVNSADLIAQRS